MVAQLLIILTNLDYTLAANDLGRMRSWVDALYSVHPDMKSHTSGITSFGTGGLLGKLTKQKLNTKSSTEAELVGASDYLPHTMWVKMFMEAQGHNISKCVLEQDNESAIKLELNGRSLAGPRSRHIIIRYFWIRDVSEENDIRIMHCSTLQMLADFLPSHCKEISSETSGTSFSVSNTLAPSPTLHPFDLRSVLVTSISKRWMVSTARSKIRKKQLSKKPRR
jgi:hypothetical protein